MPVDLKIVQPDAQSVPPIPSDLTLFGIHPLFRQTAFRYADHSHYLPLDELDKNTYDLSDLVYDRMKPALRLATLFLRQLMPELARVGLAKVEEFMFPDGYKDKVLTDEWQFLQTATESFERHTLGLLSTKYRFTILTREFARRLCDAHGELAGTSTLITHDPDAEFDFAYPQTALNSSWFWYFAGEDWETISTEEKYAKHFLFASTLIHELAHAVWINRVLTGAQIKGVGNGEIDLGVAEPRCFAYHEFAELGCAMELELFESIPSFPHFGTPTVSEAACRDDPSKVLFTILDVKGRAMDIHEATTKTIYSFFDPRFWAPMDENIAAEFEIELLANTRVPRRRLSTCLSDPRSLNGFNVPVLSMPFPGMLKPAITADNELFD
ncbi:hypothetical protein Z517_10650 [Fonsecaea pedrosoi CBS 271.37]|uniref:Uncharacterized protein n=1 Tax=Fonsecaea pedrosoi CBS 271.37 TaxID=1442368 RepID=A0A0D2GAT0_9EURO|nr:uncharacterized protein Z517_10650 [Fonsecaea pedrosoi CBS 271.37]KIW75905.1 hypothetical protein Z517_10650 [Fonsecaea pedrosoi CBS 271.37]